MLTRPTDYDRVSGAAAAEYRQRGQAEAEQGESGRFRHVHKWAADDILEQDRGLVAGVVESAVRSPLIRQIVPEKTPDCWACAAVPKRAYAVQE